MTNDGDMLAYESSILNPDPDEVKNPDDAKIVSCFFYLKIMLCAAVPVCCVFNNRKATKTGYFFVIIEV